MTTISKYLKIALSIVLSCGFAVSTAKAVDVEVVIDEARGNTLEDAQMSGLKQALSQVTGVTIDAEDISKMKSEMVTNETDGKINQSSKFSDSLSSNLKTKIKGSINSYMVTSKKQDEDGSYILSMVVHVEKYNIPGKDSDRLRLVIAGVKANNEKCFGNNYSGSKISGLLTQNLVTGYTSSRKFSVLDRDNKDVYDLEKALIMDEDTRNSEMAKLGNVLATDFIVTGKVNALNITSSKQYNDLSGDVYYSKKASADIEYRLITFATRQIKSSGVVKVSLTNKEISNLSCDQIVNQLSSKAASIIVQQNIDNIYPILVLSVKGKNIYLNFGGEGIKKGDIYAIYNKGEKLIDPYTGESLGAEETQIGYVKITDVKPKYSVAQMVEGDIGTVEQGFVCRKDNKQFDSEKPKPAATKRKPMVSEDDW